MCRRCAIQARVIGVPWRNLTRQGDFHRMALGRGAQGFVVPLRHGQPLAQQALGQVLIGFPALAGPARFWRPAGPNFSASQPGKSSAPTRQPVAKTFVSEPGSGSPRRASIPRAKRRRSAARGGFAMFAQQAIGAQPNQAATSPAGRPGSCIHG